MTDPLRAAAHLIAEPTLQIPDTLQNQLSAMTADRDWLLSERQTLLGAYKEALTELRKVSEELGALKGEQFEMSKDASRWQFWLKQSGSDLRNKEIQAMWAGCKTNYPSSEEWIAAVDAAIVTKNTGEQS